MKRIAFILKKFFSDESLELGLMATPHRSNLQSSEAAQCCLLVLSLPLVVSGAGDC